MDGFEGQIAVVTGGASGIGKAVAKRLVSRGAVVTIVDRCEKSLSLTADEFKALGYPITTSTADIGSEEEVSHAFKEVVSRAGRLDIVVHCAGIVGPNGVLTAEVSVEDFDQVYKINLRGSFLIVKHAVPQMQRNGYGRILLFASIAGKEGNAGMSCYSATKAGVIGLTKSAGKEYAETGITINAIAPAVIQTSMVDAMNPNQVKYMTDKIPMKRCGTLDEVSSLAIWIVSKDAGFNTGCVFDLSGGRATY